MMTVLYLLNTVPALASDTSTSALTPFILPHWFPTSSILILVNATSTSICLLDEVILINFY
ncbi:conserved hypothetical protein [Clostridioides difficile]|uniref:Uncharacterized protein n=2 Tax=Clostridioides difficile TaxID=1496 RepID=F3Y614_CLOD6|nr:conserved hypothetical protein [Clostridioides difficile 630]CCL89033.1 Conserved hypothetical protein [Clostridioides difficile T10]CEJ99740.1 conserved hypothetical protein [Clostridioides difficile]